ncbi:MAG: hypothetical protein ACLSS9_11090, partial [Acutalibacteraceae bacterium]
RGDGMAQIIQVFGLQRFVHTKSLLTSISAKPPDYAVRAAAAASLLNLPPVSRAGKVFFGFAAA